MDGARFANAVVESGLDPSEMIAESGVDILCFGSTKNGAMVGDAVIFFDSELAHEFEYRCKQAGPGFEDEIFVIPMGRVAEE